MTGVLNRKTTLEAQLHKPQPLNPNYLKWALTNSAKMVLNYDNDDNVDEDGFCETKKTTFEAQAPPASWKAASAVSA